MPLYRSPSGVTKMHPMQARNGYADAESLGVESKTRVWVGGNDSRARRAIESLVGSAQRPATGPIDVAIITPSSDDEAVYFAQKLVDRLSLDAFLWIIEQRVRPSGSSAIAPWLTELGFCRGERVGIDDAFVAIAFQLERDSEI